MKHVVLIGFVFMGYGLALLRAGSILPLADNGPEQNGKLTLTPTTIRVENTSSPAEINLSDVLEADFSDTPFQMDFYYSNTDKTGRLPPNWQSQDIGSVDTPGSVAVNSGTFTLSGSGTTEKARAARLADSGFFVGRPWTGNGQWTVHVDSLQAAGETGINLRDTLDPTSIVFNLGAMRGGEGSAAFRAEAGGTLQGKHTPMDLPIWMRLTGIGTAVFASISPDGKDWNLIGENTFKSLSSTPWIGLFLDSRKENGPGTAVFDQISFTPAPSSAEILPPGVLLLSGSFLAGSFQHLITDPTNPDVEGDFRRNGKIMKIPRSKIAAVIMLPTARSQLTEMISHVGLLMKNGDVMDGDFDSINGNSVLINSVLLGITTYDRSQVSACILHPLQTMPASYQLRLHDGSIVNGNTLSPNNADIAFQEATGINVDIAPGEVAQFRAGPSIVQPLAELAWKAALPVNPTASPTAPIAPVSATPPASPGANVAPVATTGTDVPPVQSWLGPNQEQILEAGTGTAIEFPLSGRFRAVGVRIALSPDSPANSQVTIRILANGREVGTTPPFKAGDQPRFMEVSLQDPQTVTLEADSIFAGPKVLFIDPIAIRDN